MSSFAPIPAQVIERLPVVLSNHAPGSAHPDPFDIQIQAFTGDDGAQAFAVEVYTNPMKVTPPDRRQKPYMEAFCTTYFFTAAGGHDGEPAVSTTRYR